MAIAFGSRPAPWLEFEIDATFASVDVFRNP